MNNITKVFIRVMRNLIMMLMVLSITQRTFRTKSITPNTI